MRSTIFYKTAIVLLFCCLLAFNAFAQADTTLPGIFDRIAQSVQSFRPDTTAPPADRMTRKIMELRELKGGFNINEAIDYKIEEDRQKGEIPKAELDKAAAIFKTGDGRRLLDNAVTWIYRRHFTYREIRQLVRFYKTSAGQKMAADFPIIMMQSLKAGEMVKALFDQKN